MQPITRLLFASALLAPAASAQGPIYIDLSPGTAATDVTVLPATPSSSAEVIVVGVNSAGGVFRWSSTNQIEQALNATSSGGNVRVSTDGVKVTTTVLAPDGFTKAARFDGTTWIFSPGLGVQSGTSESTSYAISGDGNTVGGLVWSTPGAAHACTWSFPANTITDLGGPFSDPSSRLNGLNGDGSIRVGWKSQLNGTRQGAYWIGNVLQPQFTLGGLTLGEAFATNAAGTTIVGFRILGGTGVNATAAWRWDSGVITTLPNLPNETTQAVPTDMTDDVSMIVGHSGGNVLSGTRDIVWFNGQPTSLHAYLTGLGTQGIGVYPDLGNVTAISADGSAIVGHGTGLGTGQPAGGWIVIFPAGLQAGTPFCFGDGTGTACPCGNVGASDSGCASSVNASGGRLVASGVASLAADSLGLFGDGMPNSSALYFQGTSRVLNGMGSVFGDGLRCAGGTVVRLGTKANTLGSSIYPGPADQSISVRGNVTTAGSVRTYQCWYRNAAAFCTPSTFNLTNGVEIVWGA